MERRYRGRVDCAYIDPPYNAKSSEILYKNDYKHSSWLSLMDSRLGVARPLLSKAATFVIAIDEVEQERLGHLLSLHFSSFAKHCVVVEHNPSGQQGDNFSYTHEYAYFLHPVPGRYIAEQFRKDPSTWDKRNFRDVTGEESVRTAAKNCFYPIIIRGSDVVGFGDVCPDDYHPSINEEIADGVIAVYPIDPRGIERKWRFSRTTVEAIKEDLIVHYLKGRGVYDIKRLKKEFNYKSNWTDALYSANNHGTQLLNRIIPDAATLYPKSVHTVRDCCHAALNNNEDGLVLDYFAGSGTTGHAVINLNRDGGHRRFILVEMAQYFDTVLLPRVKKVTFSPEWKNGRPARLATPGETERSPRIVKVVRLESYEDTLNNLVVRRPEQVQRPLLGENSGGGPNAAREDYIIRYMLDVETGDSPSLLDLSAFLDPSAYHLKVKRPGSDESREVTVDLVETFNWLLGLRVIRMSAARRYDAEFGDAGESTSTATVALKQTPGGPWWFRTIEGLLPDDRSALIIWRNRPGGDEATGIERDNAVLEAWYKQSGHVGRRTDFDSMYVNGDHNLDSLKDADQPWTGQTIEDHFKRLMFEDAE